MARLLMLLTCEDTPWAWSTVAEKYFLALKYRLTSTPTLGYLDPTLPYTLNMDASQEAVGAVLSQVQEGWAWVIECFSQTLTTPERT